MERVELIEEISRIEMELEDLLSCGRVEKDYSRTYSQLHTKCGEIADIRADLEAEQAEEDGEDR